jgi:hypothetical protein
MKLLLSALAASALALGLAPAQAAIHHHHMHVAYYHHHYHHHYIQYYAGGPPGYGPAPGYYPGPYYAPGAYVPGYFFATPEEPQGDRNSLKALIDSEWDPPFSGR